MKKILSILSIIALFCSVSLAQRGKDGARVVLATEIATVNDYTTLNTNATAGDITIDVANSTLGTNFTSNLAQGDLIMLIQIQGTSVDDSIHTPFPTSSKFTTKWGEIINYNNCGNYEFVQVLSVPNGTTINLDCGLANNYTALGNVVIVRVPRFSSLTINNTGTLTAPTWNGSIGGILAVEVDGLTTIDAGGIIDVSEIGFRGGQHDFVSGFGGGRYADSQDSEGGEKGEGIAGDQVEYDNFNDGGARYCRGAAANAGGGGNSHNAGGGGGSNAGAISNWNEGRGVPDPLFNVSWALETQLPTIVGANSSGGGRGGYSHCSNDENELDTAPDSSDWGGDNRREVGGLGGRPLDYSTGKIFMGGGGGAADGNNNLKGATPGDGGNGGGIAFITTFGNISGGGIINANGQDGFNCESTAPLSIGDITGLDGAGGAGGGGTVLIQTIGTVSGITINANGGNGGNQVIQTRFNSTDEFEGPGGGGGGGYIAVTSGSPTTFSNGGFNGTTNSNSVSNFNANGATSGGTGTPSASIDAFEVTARDTSICSNTTVTITAVINGTIPVGATVEWYDAEFGGNLVFTGNPYTTPSLTADTTLYIKVCPATYLVPIVVTVLPCVAPVADFSSTDSTICISDCIDFTDLSTGSPTGWSWHFFGATTTTSSAQNPTNICYPGAGSFDVALVASNGVSSDSLFMPNFITVSGLPTVTASIDTTICLGDTANISVSGTATSYNWDNSLGAGTSFLVNPTVNTTYLVTGTDGNSCSFTDSVIVTVSSCSTPPVVDFSATDSSICIGDCIDFTDLSTNIPTGWTWYFFGATTTSSTNQNPTNICYNTAGSFDVALVDTNSFGKDSLFIANFITVNALPNIVTSIDTTICNGDQVNLSATGATTYNWDNGLGAGQIQTPSPTVNTVYHVTGTDANGCVSIDSVSVTVTNCNIPPVAALSVTSSSICINDCIDYTDISTGGIPTSWSWYFEGGNPSNSNLPNPTNICYDTVGSYDAYLVVTNAFGQDSIYMNNYITIDSCNNVPTVLIIPNVFSPNRDGENDLFGAFGNNISVAYMEIYNRWGEVMYKSSLINSGWDGRTSAGSKCPQGTYFYIMEIDGEVYKGSLTLLR